MKLIKLNTDHYIIVDDSEIREGDWYIDDTKSIRQSITSDQSYWSKRKEYKKITHSTQPFELLSENGLSGMGFSKVRPLNIFEVKELIGEVDVEKKSYDILKGFVITKDERRYFELGYTKALEDNKEKKYTEEDIRDVVRLALEDAEKSVIWSKEWYPNKLADKIIQSLQHKQEWEVEFVDGKLKLK